MRNANYGWDYPPGCSGPPEESGLWEYRCHNPKCEEFGNVFEAGECADCPECGGEAHDADETVPEICEECRNLIDDCTCPQTCDACNGSGESMVDGSECLRCGGSGVVRYTEDGEVDAALQDRWDARYDREEEEESR